MHIRDLHQFLSELSENNNRPWFVMNKPRYDILRAEFLELVTALIADISRFDPSVASCDPKKALFRINRDMRFSADKSPYKTNFSASITASGLKKPSQGGGPAYYFHIDAAGTLLIAAGEYLPPPERLRIIRNRVVQEESSFARMIRDKKLKATFGDLQQEDKLVRPPKGFPSDAPHLEYLKLKSFIVWSEMNVKKLDPKTLRSELVARFKAAHPLVSWLREAK